MSRRLGSRRHRQGSHQMPDVNLVPMMDVLMTVLTFFIVISMTFNAQRLVGINLPKTKGEGTESKQAKAVSQLVVGLDPQGKVRMGDRQLTQEDLADRIVKFLTQHPDGQVILKADRGLNFKNVQDLLKTMRDIGGDRVSLSIARQSQ